MLKINEGDYSYASGLIRAKEPKAVHQQPIREDAGCCHGGGSL